MNREMNLEKLSTTLFSLMTAIIVMMSSSAQAQLADHSGDAQSGFNFYHQQSIQRLEGFKKRTHVSDVSAILAKYDECYSLLMFHSPFPAIERAALKNMREGRPGDPNEGITMRNHAKAVAQCKLQACQMKVKAAPQLNEGEECYMENIAIQRYQELESRDRR